MLRSTPTPKLDDGVCVFGINASDVSLKIHAAVPLLLAERFLLSERPGFLKGLYVDPAEVSLCGDAFELMKTSDHVYVAKGKWDFVDSATSSGASPYFFGGNRDAMLHFLSEHSKAQTVNMTRAAEIRFQLVALAVGAKPFPPSRVAEATGEACEAVMRAPDSCEDFPFVALVDRRRCFVEGREEYGNFCPSRFMEPLYKLPPDVNHEQLRALPKRTRDALMHHNRSLLPYLHYARQFEKCPLGRRSAVLGMAANYHNKHAIFGDRLAPFVNSFLRSCNRRCTDLVLFINGPRPPYPSWDRVVWVDMSDFQLTERPQCNPTESRMEYFYLWLVRNGGLHYGMVAIVDVRDVFFQDDPFSSLLSWSQWPKVAATPEWILLPSESLSISSRSAFLPKAFHFYKMWQDVVFGRTYRRLLSNGTLPTGEALPIVNSGLLVGTAQAATELLAVMYELLLPTVNGTVCGVDQSLLTMLVYTGLHAAGFAPPVWIANPEYAIYRNGVERAADALWRNNTLVNCLGERYSIVHQFEPSRHPWVWRYAMAAMRIDWGPKKPSRNR